MGFLRHDESKEHSTVNFWTFWTLLKHMTLDGNFGNAGNFWDFVASFVYCLVYRGEGGPIWKIGGWGSAIGVQRLDFRPTLSYNNLMADTMV